MKNYYEILQVSPKASKEIIDKAFKTLAKKYHPDANPDEKKKWAEEQFKKINEAYEILSDEETRKKYDIDLSKQNESILAENESIKQRYEQMYKQNQKLKAELEDIKDNSANIQTNVVYQNNTSSNNFYQPESQEEINRRVAQSINKAYQDAYIQRMRDYGYKIRYKKTLKQKIKDIVTNILIIIAVSAFLFGLWQIPEVKESVESNKIIQSFLEAFHIR